MECIYNYINALLYHIKESSLTFTLQHYCYTICIIITLYMLIFIQRISRNRVHFFQGCTCSLPMRIVLEDLSLVIHGHYPPFIRGASYA